MWHRQKYTTIGVLISLLISACQPTSDAHRQERIPTQLVAQVNRGKISGNIDEKTLSAFAKKLALKQALVPAKKQLLEADLVDSYLELSGDYVYLVSSFMDRKTGNNIKVATELERQENSPSTYTVSL